MNATGLGRVLLLCAHIIYDSRSIQLEAALLLEPVLLLEVRHGVNPLVIGPGLITRVHGCTFGTLLICVRHSGCMISRR